MNAIFRVFLTFIGLRYQNKTKTAWIKLNMVNFQDILDLIDKKCFNGLINGHDVQLGGHKFHKNGKNQKKQSV